MNRTGRRGRGVLLLVLAGWLAGGWLLAAAPPAAAHALVVATSPDAGTRLAHAPAELRVVFSEAVRPLGSGLALRGPRGPVRVGAVRQPAGRPAVLAATVPGLADGAYTATWRVISADDGHVEAGAFTFGVGASATLTPAAPTARQLPPPGQVTARWVLTAGVLLLAGTVTTALLVWRRAGPITPGEPPYATLALLAGLLAVAGVVLELAVDAGTATGSGLPGGLAPGAVRAFLAAAPGTARRAGGELAVVAATVILVRRRAARGRRPGLDALALSVGAVVVLVLGAHATGLDPRWLFVGVETLHLLAVATWAGGLVALAVTARRAGMAAVRRFSTLALPAVLVIAGTGAWQALAQIPGRAALTGTDYGRVLLAKTIVFAAVLVLAAVARWRLLPRAGQDRPPPPLRRLVAVEAAGTVGVVLVAALLANTIPASEVVAARTASQLPGGPQQRTLTAGPLRLTLALEPGTVGLNTISVLVTDPAGRPVDGLGRLGLTVADDTGRVDPVPLAASRVAPATYRAASTAFTVAGTWQVTVRVPGADPNLAARFGIAPGQATTGQPPPDPADATVLGGRAGRALVGLTAFPADPGLVVRVRGGLGIPPPATPRPLRLVGPDGRPRTPPTQHCGDGCLEAFLATPRPGRWTVLATLPGGTTRFALPIPLPSPAAARLHRADRTLAAARAYRIHEVLDGGYGTVFRTDYTLKAPNLARWHLDTGTTTTDTIWIGEDHYTRQGTSPWKHEHTPELTIAFPAPNWSGREGNVTDLGPSRWHGTPVDVLAFIDLGNGAYHRLWVDHDNRILHERMDAPGHFMDRDYTSYGQPVSIHPPP
ncbi:MAG TPA: CopD family protein [Actinomycetes bacterium]|nr:CopD family protein [Actinomycetes bacterium]